LPMNSETARTLGLTTLPSILARTDEVSEQVRPGRIRVPDS